jgi:hypothetical protein
MQQKWVGLSREQMDSLVSAYGNTCREAAQDAASEPSVEARTEKLVTLRNEARRNLVQALVALGCPNDALPREYNAVIDEHVRRSA